MSLIFYMEIFHLRNVASETIACSWVGPVMFSHTQTCLHLSRVPFVVLRVWTDQKCFRIKDEVIIRKKVFFQQFNTQNFKLLNKSCSCPIRLQDSLIINISGTKQSVSSIFRIDLVTKKNSFYRLLLSV